MVQQSQWGPPPPKRRRRGFTLIEMMIVVAIVGITATIAVPNIIGTVRAREAEGQMLEVQHILLRARNRARNAVCVMHVTVATNSITVGPDPSDPSADCLALDTLQYDVGEYVTLTDFTVNGATTDPLVLNAQGGTDYDYRARMIATNTYDGATRNLELWPAIGSVTVGQ
jgi:prepilin-type N-terminal cleavage/methylation domain-containing protein